MASEEDARIEPTEERKEAPAFVEPPKENAEGQIDKYGIAIHLVLSPPRWPSEDKWPPKRDKSDALRSFEEDILAYASPSSHGQAAPKSSSRTRDALSWGVRHAPGVGRIVRPGKGQPAPERDEAGASAPFCTYAVDVPEGWQSVSVTFPAEVVFWSEGLRVSLRAHGLDGSERVRRRFKLRASRTDFHRSELSVLHLVLGPDPDYPEASAVNEYDLIKLMKLWQPGEGLTRSGIDGAGKQFVTFYAGLGDPPIERMEGADANLTGADLALYKLAHQVFQLEREDPTRLVDVDGPRAGTVQIVHRCWEKEAKCGNICSEIEEVLKHEGAVEEVLNKREEREGPPGPWRRLEALGGLVCGLLDFADIDGDELADVFRETWRDEQSVRSFHKGTLFVASGKDRAFDAEGIRESVGLSPYLLIPHAVLLHNEWWLADAVKKLADAHDRGTRQRVAVRAHVARTLSWRLVPNVFNYQDERRVYARGLKARGLRVRELQVRERLEDAAQGIHAQHDGIRDFIGAAIALVVLGFTISDVSAKHSTSYVILLVVLTVAVLVGFLDFFVPGALQRFSPRRETKDG